MDNILLLGGGLSGLVAGELLSEKGYKVTVIEREPVLGGLARSFNYKNKWIPITYHHILSTENVVKNYIKKFGLKKQLVWRNVRVAFWFNEKPHPLTGPLDILRFAHFSSKDKLRLFKLGIYSFFKNNWSDTSGINAQAWLEKKVGKNVTETLFKNLAEIKFGQLNSVDMAWLGKRLNESARNREKFAYLKCGLHRFVEKLSDSILRNNGTIFTNMCAVKVKKGTVLAQDFKGKTKEFQSDKIISSIPPPELAKIGAFEHTVRKRLQNVKFQPMVCLVCGSPHNISKHYWNAYMQPRLSFGGFFHHTILNPNGGINGEKLYYFFTYLEPNNSLFKKTEKQIADIYLKDIRKLKKDFKFRWFRVFKIKYSSPLFHVGYKNLPIRISDGFYLTGVYNQYPSVRTMNTALESGIKTAKFIINE